MADSREAAFSRTSECLSCLCFSCFSPKAHHLAFLDERNHGATWEPCIGSRGTMREK